MTIRAEARPTATADRRAREEALVQRVVRSFDACSDPRLQELVTALVRHLHAFVREVGLTEAEWGVAVDFLARCGRITDEHRQEFILLSDVLGVSMQTVTVNDEAVGGATESTVFGPFFVEGSPRIEIGGDISGGAPGEPCWVDGAVRDIAGEPVAGARVEVWEADGDGFYDVQYPDARVAGRAHLFTGDDGGFGFWAVTPTPYPIPADGPVGELLSAVGRSPMRAAHLHFMVTAPGFRRLVTHIFVDGDEHVGRDSVFGEQASLVKRFVRHEASEPVPAGRDLGGLPWSSSRFDIVLAPEPG
ncbi:dioxygenase family protein [Pseudonocardia dioxanivorans]|jgi:hydroxyquinol 1,2-dioxygenase|uniref:dioxygenase family protein n=1 Tax=Pseudonocardia dioxanivorans TaxID=240495 RepID=UPI000CD14C0F|nr:dioxygenase [Pseudonocardia dioxanivorans]